MKRTALRLAAVSLAVAGLAVGPAAAAAPASHELPGTPVVTAPDTGTIVTPNASFCDVVKWWIWCRR